MLSLFFGIVFEVQQYDQDFSVFYWSVWYKEIQMELDCFLEFVLGLDFCSFICQFRYRESI